MGIHISLMYLIKLVVMCVWYPCSTLVVWPLSQWLIYLNWLENPQVINGDYGFLQKMDCNIRVYYMHHNAHSTSGA